ncbi:hypothetical protein [Autumnicola psychrophila]|uniref:Uncharacterized protein n=1 Tax=Autumnicola psychrophila TaxID=3075592 RepID=A0ABU3DT19_9FLAO|nr:hypothetical protein [Zunongwangia sp. F225]MDT0686232.1 hypothetical protein [Zunongwangia sp. F225]
MRAAYYEDFEGPEALKVGELEIPELKKTEALLKKIDLSTDFFLRGPAIYISV